MWRPNPGERPEGAKLAACVTTAVLSSVLLVAAGVFLAVGHAGVTLIILPVVFVLAGYATFVLESSRRRARPA